MNQKKNKEIWLTGMAMALLSCELLLIMAVDVTGFYETSASWGMFLSAGCVCILFGIAVKLQMEKWFYPGMLLLGLLLVLIGGKHLLDGFCVFWNGMGDVLTAVHGWVLPELGSLGDGGTDTFGLLLFSIFTGSMTAVICCALTFHGKQTGAVFYALSACAGMLVFGSEPMIFYEIALLCMAVVLLLWNREEGVWGRILPVAVTASVVLTVSSLSFVQNWADDVGEAIQEKLHNNRYETDYTTLPEGDFQHYVETKDDNLSALVVTMERPEELYLRGFTGAVYKEHVWSPLEAEVLAENETLLCWLNQNEKNLHTQFAEISALAGNEEEQTVTVQNLNACSKYLYVPYQLSGSSMLDEKNISPDVVSGNGERTYLYKMVSGGTEQVRKTLEYVQTAKEEEALKYREAENAYRSFVENNYMEIPEEAAKMLLPYWEQAASAYGKREDLTFEQAQECALDFLEFCFPEEGEAPEMDLPLANAEGSSYQYATVAAFTLRYFGIPSRYVEGYVLTKEMAEAAEANASIQVGSGCAGAWVEVYQDGLGWLPMNVTPGVEEEEVGINPELEDGETPKKKLKKGKELEEETEEIVEEPQPQGGYMVTVRKMLSYTFLFVILLIILFLLFVVLRRSFLLKRRNKRWEAEEIKDGAAWIFADTEKILGKLGFSRGYGSMAELIHPLREKFGTEYAKQYEEMVWINAKALFSSRELEEECRIKAKAFYDATLQQVKAEVKWYRRLWMQWVLCLY